MIIGAKNLCGFLAKNVWLQHPYHDLSLVNAVADRILAAASDWEGAEANVPWRTFDDWVDVLTWLEETLYGAPELSEWNTPKSGHTQTIVASSRYWGPAPEDDFIDIDALLRNVALDAWREEERENSVSTVFLSYTEGKQ